MSGEMWTTGVAVRKNESDSEPSNLWIERTWPHSSGSTRAEMNEKGFGSRRGVVNAGHAAHPNC